MAKDLRGDFVDHLELSQPVVNTIRRGSLDHHSDSQSTLILRVSCVSSLRVYEELG